MDGHAVNSTHEPHAHAWRITEIDYDGCVSVRVFECTCGQIDYRNAA